jgi:hypothetical protein
VETQLKLALSQRQAVQSMLQHHTSLISQITQPVSKPSRVELPWFKYKIRSPQDQSSWMRLVIAHRAPVERLNWFQSAHLEIFVHKCQLRILATPLGKVDDTTREKQIEIGDMAILMGHFIVLANVRSSHEKEILQVKNCIRIEHVIEIPLGANRNDARDVATISTKEMFEMHLL